MSQLIPGSSLGFLLTDIARLFRQTFDREVESAGLDLTSGEIRTLAFVARFPASRQTVLAERMGVEPMTLSAYVERLEQRGLIVRTPDPSDRRAKNVNLSGDAEAVFELARPIALNVYDKMIGHLPSGDVEMLTRALFAMRANLATDPAIRSEPYVSPDDVPAFR